MDAATVLLSAMLAWHPGLDREVGQAHVAAAQAAEVEGVEAALLLALAWYESGWQEQALAYQECRPKHKKCKRKTKRRHDSEASPQHGRAPWFCGALQIGTRSWSRCREILEDVDEGYRTAVVVLQEWSRYCTRKGRTECTLRGYHGGFRMLARTSDPYPRRVLALAERFRRRMQTGFAWTFAPAPTSSPN
jgi:hypothetical protein